MHYSDFKNYSFFNRTINAGKTNKINEDQSFCDAFYITVPEEFWDDETKPEKVTKFHIQAFSYWTLLFDLLD